MVVCLLVFSLVFFVGWIVNLFRWLAPWLPLRRSHHPFPFAAMLTELIDSTIRQLKEVREQVETYAAV